MSKNLSHAECNHPATKVARAKCRRELAKLVTTVVAVASVVTPDSPIITAWNSMIEGPRELTAAPVEITRENWREFKGQRVRVRVENQFLSLVGEITGWSVLNFQIKTDEKTVRIPASTVESVELSERV